MTTKGGAIRLKDGYTNQQTAYGQPEKDQAEYESKNNVTPIDTVGVATGTAIVNDPTDPLTLVSIS
jgi:hypothetical protein